MRRTSALIHSILLFSVLAATMSCRGLPLARFTQPLPAAAEQPGPQLEFVCNFDLPPDHRLVRALMAERDEVYSTIGIPPSDEKIFVHLFNNAEAYNEILTHKFPMVPNRRAFFVETDTELHVYAHWSDRIAEDMRHEVAHGYLHASVPAIPLWIDEGLAEYFEVPHGHEGLNRPHLLLLADLIEHNRWLPNLQRLEALSTAGEMQQEHYAEAWAWVYFLLNSTPQRRELLTEYLMDLRQYGKAKPLSARLASQQIQPQRTLTEYLLTLKSERSG